MRTYRAHAAELRDLSEIAEMMQQMMPMVTDPTRKADLHVYLVATLAAQELLECHDATGIDLYASEHWLALVETMLGRPIDPEET